MEDVKSKLSSFKGYVRDITAPILMQPLREKSPNTEFFPLRIFPHSNWIRRVSLRIQSQYAKTRTRKNSVFEHFSRSELIAKTYSMNSS